MKSKPLLHRRETATKVFLFSPKRKLVQIDNFGSVDAVSAFRIVCGITSVHVIETGETTNWLPLRVPLETVLLFHLLIETSYLEDMCLWIAIKFLQYVEAILTITTHHAF